jgi:phenylpropionate dioxygenase-like ring-hydroxylating dioxygenase large terminal subunit
MECYDMSNHHNNLINKSPRIAQMKDELRVTASAPDDSPMGLPGRFYSDQDYFEHECQTTLAAGWHCVGRADELVDTGDYFTVKLLGEPLIIVKNEDGIKALSNVCRHRGMPLADGQGNTKRFVCSYHAWTYGTDGALLRATRMKNAGFDPKTCKLGTFACVERYGFIYVNLSDDPVDIDQDLAGLTDLIGAYEPENYRIVHTETEIWNTNWKCLVENFMEGYHLSVVHPQTLHGYTPTGLSVKGDSGEGFTSYYANYPEDMQWRGTGSPKLDPKERHRSTLFAVYPCQVVSIAASLLVSLSIRPLTADSIEVKWTMSAYGDELDEYTIEQRVSLWQDVNREDREKLEIMQNAMKSVHAAGGPLAGPNYEGTVRDFLLWLARQNERFAKES